MWVFGYGSLIWNPGFGYQDSQVGFIRGYVRRFWQGNDFHRGNPDKLGRVATVVEDEQGLTWGRAFLLGPDAESSLSYLNSRENKLGGYCTTIVTFYPRGRLKEPFPVLLYMALPSSPLYMGPAPLSQVATDIAEAVGHCGHNAEYLLKLANFMKEHVPEAWDEHLYSLDRMVRLRLKDRNLTEEDVMSPELESYVAAVAGGFTDEPTESSALNLCLDQMVSLTLKDKVTEEDVMSPDLDYTVGGSIDEPTENRHRLSFSQDFASRVPSRKLRCLDK